jgi:UDP-N-acetylglucosamine 2-epimerase (non-hydrolysing)
MKQILAVVGTRSELARLAPALRVLRDQYSSVMRPRLMHTGEKTHMVWSTGALFGLVPERQHALSEDTMTLADLSWQISNAVGHELDSRATDLVLVQGGSMTAMLAGQQAFLRQIPVVHVDSLAARFAEMSSLSKSNRRMLAAISSFRCVPDRAQAEELRQLGYPAYEMGVTGSCAVEAARMVLANGQIEKVGLQPPNRERVPALFVALKDGEDSRTASSELGFALASLAHDNSELRIHVMSPTGRSGSGLLLSIIGALPNVKLVSPSDYYSYLKALDAASVVLTNSEDIAEEALALARPVVLMQTELAASWQGGPSEMRTIPSTQDSVINAVEMALAEHSTANGSGHESNHSSIGDGKASLRIVRLLNNWARNRVLTSHSFEPFDSGFQGIRAAQPEGSTPLMQ